MPTASTVNGFQFIMCCEESSAIRAAVRIFAGGARNWSVGGNVSGVLRMSGGSVSDASFLTRKK